MFIKTSIFKRILKDDICNMQCVDKDRYEYCVECPEYEEEQ